MFSFFSNINSHSILDIQRLIKTMLIFKNVPNFLKINFLLKDNCFTEFHCFLSNLNMN